MTAFLRLQTIFYASMSALAFTMMFMVYQIQTQLHVRYNERAAVIITSDWQFDESYNANPNYALSDSSQLGNEQPSDTTTCEPEMGHQGVGTSSSKGDELLRINPAAKTQDY